MGLLRGSSVYLIGSVDHHKDPRAWRNEIREELLEPLGIKVYDPMAKPGWFNDEYPQLGDDPTKDFLEFKDLLNDKLSEYTRTGPIGPMAGQEMVKIRMSAVRDLCLRMAHDSSFIIGSVPKKFSVGTFEELGVATLAKKPVLLYLPDGFATSTWLPAQIPNFFSDSFTRMDDLYNRIRSIDSGEAIVDNLEWMFLSYFNDEEVKHEFSNNRQIRT